jgi:hypothetical protein
MSARMRRGPLRRAGRSAPAVALDKSHFEEYLSNASAGVVHDVDGQHETVIIAFGGIWMGVGGLPPFEFFRQLGDVPADRAFVRDLDQSWYQLGVRGIGDDIRASAEWVSSLCRQHRVQRVVCIGCSAGAFAAMAFGSLIGADVIHAFAAQTTIDEEDLRELRDTRWDEHLKRMRKKLGKRQPVLDVRPLLASSASRPETYVHWGSAEPRDTRHALRLDGIPNVHLVPHEALGHDDLTRALRDQGELHRVILESLERGT